MIIMKNSFNRGALWRWAVGGGFLIYLAFNLIQGDRGLLALLKLKQIVKTEETTLARLTKEQENLSHHIRLLRPKSLDLDLLDERARDVLNEAALDEILLDPEEVLMASP